MPPFLALGALVCGALQVDSAADPSISWSVEPGLACPTQGQLESAYFQQSVAATRNGSPAVAGFVEVGQSSGGQLTVRFTIPALRLTQRRDLAAAKGTCRDVAESIAILVHAWLTDLPVQSEKTQSTAANLPPRQPTQDDAAWVPAPNHVQSAAPARVRGINASSPSWIALSLGLGIGAWLPFGGEAAPSLALDARLRVSKALTIGLLGMWVADLSVADVPYGSLLIHRQLFGASVSVAVPWADRLALGFGADFVAALIVMHAEAQSYAYPVTVRRDLFDPGLLAGARIQQLVSEALFLQAQISAVALNRSYTFQAQRPGGDATTVATLPAFVLDLEVGVGVQIF